MVESTRGDRTEIAIAEATLRTGIRSAESANRAFTLEFVASVRWGLGTLNGGLQPYVT